MHNHTPHPVGVGVVLQHPLVVVWPKNKVLQ